VALQNSSPAALVLMFQFLTVETFPAQSTTQQVRAIVGAVANNTCSLLEWLILEE
jgi:hypothetical protein